MPIADCDISLSVMIPHPSLVNLYNCRLQADVFVGPFVEIQRGVVVGPRTRVQSHSFICEGVTVGSDVFIGHGVRFINDRYPRVHNPDWQLEVTVVEDYVSIGSGAVIMCGVKLGHDSIIGAGAVVLQDVPPGVTVIGNPARELRG